MLPALQLYKVREEDQCIFGLAYDSFASRYKVICVGFDETGKWFAAIATVGVEGPWRCTGIPEPRNKHLCPPVFAKGCLYWMQGGMNEGDLVLNENQHAPELNRNILYMDVGEELFGALIVPASDVYTLHEMRGLLCFANHVSKTRLDLWVMIQGTDGLQENQGWVLECSVDVGSELSLKGFRDMCFPFATLSHPRNKIILKCYHPVDNEDNQKSCFICCDLQSQHLENALDTKVGWFFVYGYAGLRKYYPCVYVRSLTRF